MLINKSTISTQGIKFYIKDGDEEIGRAYLYILNNDLHSEPFGFMEDVFVDEKYRSQGLGEKLVEALIKEAKNQGCYKLIGNSRHERLNVHRLYEKLSFKSQGLEFRIDF